MNTRGKYKSKHYEELLEYLKKIPGKHFTVNELYREMAEKGSQIGSTTIYRQLNRMVEEGLVSKYTIEPNAPSCYEYVEVSMPMERSSCYHCKCEVCGRLIHLHCGEMEGLGEHLLKEHSFQINPMRTVFYGVCQECLLKGKPVKIIY